MDERPEQRPEGKLLAAALKRSKLSQRQAAAKAHMSENRWRAIMHGYQSVGGGVNAAVRGPADTLARMAQVVGVSPDQLEEVGREDAAKELRELLAAEPSRSEDDQSIATLAERFRNDPELALKFAELVHRALRPGDSEPSEASDQGRDSA